MVTATNTEEIICAIYEGGTYTHPQPEVGKAIIRALLDSGANSRGAEAVYRSKHVRWFFDEHGDRRTGQTGEDTYELFKNHIATNRNGVWADMKKWNRSRT